MKNGTAFRLSRLTLAAVLILVGILIAVLIGIAVLVAVLVGVLILVLILIRIAVVLVIHVLFLQISFCGCSASLEYPNH